MAQHFTIDLLPASDGDAMILEWGDDASSSRMLVDGGRGESRLSNALSSAFAARSDAEHAFDVVVSTHMDADHIAGLVGLLRHHPSTFSVGEFWFNAFRHLPPTDVLGWKQSDRLEELIADYVTKRPETKWNQRFGEGGALVLADRPANAADLVAMPPSRTIGGMTITLLSPTLDRLRAVAAKWPAAVRKARLDLPAEGDVPPDATVDRAEDDTLGFDEDKGVEPSELAVRPYERDDTAANGASIAFLAEYAERRVLLAADAHAEVLVDTLRRLQPTGKVRLDAVKLSHHGSEKNLSPELLDIIDCPTWLISTNGSIHHHPDRRAIARLITRHTPTHLVFNYRSDETEEWGRPSRIAEYGFTSYLPARDAPGFRYDAIDRSASPLPAAD